ncbi:unnamed protein product [Oikopleura dioica]|nr:unnamed protein product [Oikopleura dioica]
MEEKIYERQVNKSSLGLRVVDEQQVDRHYSADQLKDLYKFVPKPEGERERLALPKDDLLKEIITHEKTKDWILKFHEHDSLLEHKPEESLTKDEINKAWEEYENEKKGIFSHRYNPSMHFNPTQSVFANSHNDALVDSENWLMGLSNPTLTALVKIGDEIFGDKYTSFFADRYEPKVPEMMRLLLTYNPTTPYVDALKLAVHLVAVVRQMLGNEESMFLEGKIIYEAMVKRMEDLKNGLGNSGKVPIKIAPRAYFKK